MDLEGIACSTGSACTSQALEPSHVIMSIFNDHFRAAGSVRFSFSKLTTKEELDFAIGKLKKVVARLRNISPYGGKNGH
jgi:cysteine desulfurase